MSWACRCESDGSSVQWVATPVNSRDARGSYSHCVEEAASAEEYVYDIYVLGEHQDSGPVDQSLWDMTYEVQVNNTSAQVASAACFSKVTAIHWMQDGLDAQVMNEGWDFLEDSEDELCDKDSEDSNAEDYYTHEYPDEEDLQDTDWESNEHDSDIDS